MPFSLAAKCPMISPWPEGLTVNRNSAMIATAGAGRREEDFGCFKPEPLTPALVQVGEPCLTANPSENRELSGLIKERSVLGGSSPLKSLKVDLVPKDSDRDK